MAPKMFLIYVNDMTEGASSYISLFADDAKLLRKIRNQYLHPLISVLPSYLSVYLSLPPPASQSTIPYLFFLSSLQHGIGASSLLVPEAPNQFQHPALADLFLQDMEAREALKPPERWPGIVRINMGFLFLF